MEVVIREPMSTRTNVKEIFSAVSSQALDELRKDLVLPSLPNDVRRVPVDSR